MSELTLTLLIENSARDGLIAEHGLSVLIDHRGRRFLLDAGTSGIFAVNAERMGLDLSTVEAAFLSHGHFDHSDGLAALFAVNPKASVFARCGVTAPEYHGERYIGVNPYLFQHHGKRFDLSDAPRQVFDGVWLIPDRIPHEQSVVLETADGLVILNSCCHAGADTVVGSVLAHFPGQPVRTLIGGFHLMGRDGVSTMGPAPEEILALGSRLFSDLKVAQVWTGHCTGTPAFELLRAAFPNRVNSLFTGLTLSF